MEKREEEQEVREIELCLRPTDIEVSTEGALRIPFDQLPALGVGLSGLAKAFTQAATSTAPTLFTVTDASGKPLAASALQTFRDGSGLMGSVRDARKGFSQARLHVVTGATAPVPVIDPATLAIAAALAVVTQKLDAIQKTQEEMLEYLHWKDKSELRGALQALTDIAQDYRFNWDNATFLSNAHEQVLSIRQQADSASIFLRAQVRNKVQGGFLEVRAAVDASLAEVLDRFAEYRLATYVYAFASFLEPLLSGNDDAAYLHSVAERISEHGVAYRALYSECYDIIERRSKGSIDAVVLGGLAHTGKMLGGLLVQTPVGKHTAIDDALMGAGEGIGRFSDGVTDSLVSRFRAMRSPETLTLQQGVESLACLREGPFAIAADANALFFLPAAE